MNKTIYTATCAIMLSFLAQTTHGQDGMNNTPGFTGKIPSMPVKSSPTIPNEIIRADVTPFPDAASVRTSTPIEQKIHAAVGNVPEKQNMDNSASYKAAVRLGDEVLFEDAKYRELLRGKRVGLITNPTGMDSEFVSTIDKLHGSPDWKLTALFAPEHGIRGAETAGEAVKSGIDPVTSVPVYSLHGKDKDGKPINKPSAEQLKNVDVLIYDMQDIGNRSYTYVGTMRLCMEAARESGKKFLVLDRPNPMGGELVDGNILDQQYMSLVGWAPVAYLYGLTCGEVASWMNTEMNIGCDLAVVPMKGWKRTMKWWDTGLPWIPTSTHMQRAEQCWHIALTGFLGELHRINEGVGYPAPFEYIGAPWIDSVEFAKELNSHNLPGIHFRPVYYKPFYHIYKNELCGGVQVIVRDYNAMRPVEAGVHVMAALQKLYPEQKPIGSDETTVTQSRIKMFTKVMGSEQVLKDLQAGKPAAEIIEGWRPAREAFAEQRKKYFLYQ